MNLICRWLKNIGGGLVLKIWENCALTGLSTFCGGLSLFYVAWRFAYSLIVELISDIGLRGLNSC